MTHNQREIYFNKAMEIIKKSIAGKLKPGKSKVMFKLFLDDIPLLSSTIMKKFTKDEMLQIGIQTYFIQQ